MIEIAAYSGALLGHVETLYRPGERELAIELAEALGCKIMDTGFKGDGADTFLAAHPNCDDLNPQLNAFYMSQMRPEQQAVEERLREFSDSDPAFAGLMDSYYQAARTKPFGVPHFAIRYPSREAIEAVENRINDGPKKKLGERLNLRVFYPGDADAAVGNLVQGFIHQDVIVSGSFLMGQIIELQSKP